MPTPNDATLISGGVLSRGTGMSSGTELSEQAATVVEQSGPESEASVSEESLQAARLQKLRLLGKGGMGRVSLAFDPVLDRDVAVKELLGDLATTDSFREDFIREARINGGLHHPAIVPVHALHAGQAGSLMFTMQAVYGKNLGEWLDSTKYPVGSPERLEVGLEIFLKICDALAYAHSRGVLHCDLKPENVMVGEYGSYYLMDWGLSRPKVHEAPPSVRGTPAYMAPEQARNERLDERADIFGLGAILLEMVSGTPPYGHGTAAECLARAIRGEVIDVAEAVRDVGVSPRVCELIRRAVAAKREDRYQSVTELRDDIRAFLLGGFHLPRLTFSRGSLLVSEGELEDTAYMLVSGRCRVYRRINGVETTLREIGPGDILGELSLLLQTPRTASVVAEEQCTVLVIDRNAIDRSGAMVGWPAALMRALAHRFREMELRQDRLEGQLPSQHQDAEGKSDR